jgi:hypothetical protein
MIERRPILWDSRLENYKITELKNVVWLELANETGMTAGAFVTEIL